MTAPSAVPMTIAGRPVRGPGQTPVENPAHGEVFAHAPACTLTELNCAVAAAVSASSAWDAMGWDGRRARLLDCGVAMAEHVAEIAELLTREQGKPLREATAEVRLAAEWFRYTCELSLEPERIANRGAEIIVSRVPRGVVAAIAPSNFPVILAVVKFVPALLAGNTVVLKPSPETPLSTLRMGQILHPLLPDGVLNVVSGDAEVGAALTSHPDVGMVSFTGSVETGHRIAQASGGFKHLVLELGGNDACILLPDVDIDTVASRIVHGSLVNAGQFCAAIKRVYVLRRQRDELAAALAAAAAALVVGDGMDTATELGPVVSRKQRNRVAALVEQARRSGARVVTGGHPLERPGYFYAPTVLTDLPASTRIEYEEQFGPVIPVIEYDCLDEAVARANAGRFGLGGSVWGDEATASDVAARLDCGTVWINTHGVLRPDTPFGGTRSSGVGVEYGPWGLREFTRIRVQHMARPGHTLDQVISVVSAEMEDILFCEPLDPTADFFRHGGDSLRAVELISRLTKQYDHIGAEAAEQLGAELLTVIFEDASPSRLAETIFRQL